MKSQRKTGALLGYANIIAKNLVNIIYVPLLLHFIGQADYGVFQMTNSGFHAEIDLGKEDLVFFSVPYDDGFTAYVNGQGTDILRGDEGLMAVLAPAGENTIDFVYQADGFSLASKVSLVGLAVFVVYTGYFVWKKKKRC